MGSTVCMYVCIFVCVLCMYVCVYCVCMSGYLCVYIYVCVCVCVYVCVSVSVCVCVCGFCVYKWGTRDLYSPFSWQLHSMYSCAAPVVCLSIQKSRVSRLQNAKMAANRTFIRNKKKVDAFLVARETERERGGSGGGGEGEGRSVEMLLASQINDVDLFQLQHHHLLACLERTTVSRWMDGWMDGWRKGWS